MASLNSCHFIGNVTRDAELFPRGVAERFKAKHIPGEPDECWEWLGSKDSHGYGRLAAHERGRSPLKASRISWALANGRVPETKEHVLHSCDNPPCVNPQHLSLGDPMINAQQREERGRGRPGWVPGSRNGKAKLREGDIPVIRNAFAQGTSSTALVHYYGVDRALIRRIVIRQSWKHVN